MSSSVVSPLIVLDFSKEADCQVEEKKNEARNRPICSRKVSDYTHLSQILVFKVGSVWLENIMFYILKSIMEQLCLSALWELSVALRQFYSF